MRMTAAEQRRELFRLTVSLSLRAAERPENYEILHHIVADINKRMNMFMGTGQGEEEFKMKIDLKEERAKAIPLNLHTEAVLAIL